MALAAHAVGCTGSRSPLPVPDPDDRPDVALDEPAFAIGGHGDTMDKVPQGDLPLQELEPPQAGLKVAFIGDQGPAQGASSVLELIRREGADMVIHSGDFDYLADPAAWEARIDAVLGADFPYFANVGNHDLGAWSGPGGYQARLRRRIARVDGARCAGELGVKSACTYRGLFFVLSGAGTLGTDHAAYLRQALDGSRNLFKVCTWHKNQHDMQVGHKTDEVGWSPYQACQAAGALIVTGHEHSYARTRNLKSLGDRMAGHGAFGVPERVELWPGQTAVIVSGLGGHSQRPFTEDHEDDTWWASIYAQNLQVRNGKIEAESPDIEPGALFIEFNIDGSPEQGRGYFKTVSGQTVDDFTLLASPAAAPDETR